MAGEWMDNRTVLLLSSALEGKNDISSVQSREKGSRTKSFVPCPQVVKLYHSGMGGVDLMDQRLPHIVWIESHLLLSLLDYKIVVTKNLIQYHQCRKRAVPMLRLSKKKKEPELINNHGGHFPDYQAMRRRCAYCAMEGKENRTFAICFTCNILLCLTKRKNCFQKHPV